MQGEIFSKQALPDLPPARIMFNKILIANRGEIAVRIIRACRDLGIISVAVCSDADREALHALLADECLCIGSSLSKNSYLNIDAVLTAAVLSGADAVHPGYGFLSENSEFAERCEENGITFIGPSYKSITLMGDKSMARETVSKVGVPIIPGSDGITDDIESAKRIADKIGYPVLVKAASGGGGKGIRAAETERELANAISSAKAEAEANFGDSRIYIEKLIKSPRHIEFQILSDKLGNTVHLFERDCSVQRRHQKMIEEAPSPVLTPELRKQMGDAAVNAAKAAGYTGAGTIEFLVDADKNFYFMEMNTRIQVEHPVTEAVTGIDLIRAQIEIAAGLPLRYQQEDIKLNGCAMECRINAEDASRNFAPSPGTIHSLNVPGGLGIRVDTAMYLGYTVPPFYDSMLAKLIVSGSSRDEVISRMKRALSEFIVEGVPTNVDYQLRIMMDGVFASGDYDIDYIDKYFSKLM